MSYEDEFADCCYVAWRHGKNPDEISRDEYDRLEDNLNEPPHWYDFYEREDEYQNN